MSGRPGKFVAMARIQETAGDIDFLKKISLPNKTLTNQY
jgi:hypothetical protein